VPNGRRVQGCDPCHAWTHFCELPPSVILLLIRWHCAWPRTAPPSSSVSLCCCVLRLIQPVRRDGWLCSPNGFILTPPATAAPLALYNHHCMPDSTRRKKNRIRESKKNAHLREPCDHRRSVDPFSSSPCKLTAS
jgi:hypothetical protein